MRKNSFLFFLNLITILLVFVNENLGQEARTADDGYKNFLNQYLQKLNYSSEEIQLILNDSRLKFHSEFFKAKNNKQQLQKLKKQFEKDFFSKNSIENGKQFINRYLDILTLVEDKYGIPKEIIVAILRIESNFGQFEGKYYVINALATRAYQQSLTGQGRIDWKKELNIFLTICKENKIGIFDYKGSRAGCFGLAQFLPSNYKTFGLDGNSDGIIDLFNIQDAIFSISNYLYKMGWRGKDFYKNFHVIFIYNHDRWYVDLVIKYANLLKV